VSESADNFLYQYDLSSAMLNSHFRKNYSSAANILVFDPNTGVVCPRKVVVDTATNKLLVYFNAPKSRVISREFYVCTGLTINESDSATAFTLSGITNAWCADESSGSTLIDSAGSNNGTVTAPAVLGLSGLFGNAVSFVGNVSQRVEFTSEIFGNGDRTLSFIVRPIVESSSIILLDNARFQFSIVTTGNPGAIGRFYVSSNGSTYLAPAESVIFANITYLIVVTRKSNGIATVYVNAIQKASGSTGAPAAGTSNLRMGVSVLNGSAHAGFIDNVLLYNGINTFELDRYKLLFTPSVFSSISGVLGNSSKRHSIHTGVSVSI